MIKQRNRHYHFSLLFLFLIKIFFVFFPHQAYAKPIEWKNKALNITNQVQLFIDKESKYSFEEVRKKTFSPYLKKAVGLKPSLYTFWWKITLYSAKEEGLFFTINSPILDRVDLYRKKGNRWVVEKNGDFITDDKKEVKYRYPIFKLNFKGEREYYLKIKSPGTMSFQMNLLKANDLHNQKIKETIVDVSFFSILLVLLIYNLFIYASSRDIKYGLYCLYLFSTILNQLTISGWHNFLFELEGQFLRSDAVVTTVYLQMVVTFLLTASYLNTKIEMPKAHKILTFLSYLGGFLALLTFNYSLLKWMIGTMFQPLVKITGVILIIILGLAFYRGFKSNWEKLRMAKFYFPAYIFYILGALLVSTVYSGGIENNFLTINVWKIGISLEAVLISLGLADIINALRISDRKKAKELASLNLHLEEKVKLRTKELSESLRNTETLLHNMKQGVFIISARGNDEADSYDLIVEDKVVSRYSKEIFKQDIKGQNLYDLLYSEIDLDSEFGSGIKFALECAFHMDELQWHQGFEFLPQRITKNIDDHHIVMRITYNPLRDDYGDMEKLMIVVEDVTELEFLEGQMKKQKEKEDSYQRTLQELAPPEGQNVSFHMKQVKKFFISCNDLITETFSLLEDPQKEFFQDAKSEGVKIILRNLHTLKGNSRTIGFFSLSGIVHHFENDIETMKNEKGGFDDEAKKRILTFFTHFKETGLENYMEIAQNIFSLTLNENEEKEQEHFEVSKKKLDKLKETIQHFAPQFPKDVKNIFLDLIFKLTQIPLVDLLKPLKKTIEETSKSLSKEVLFEFNDTEVGLDKKDAQILSDCFVHIVRNSLDHGLETTDERAKLGKKDKGKISIHAETIEGEHIISIKDNGRGINHNALADKALQKGLISREDLSGMDKQEKVHLIFAPGFSTKEDVTDLSGRGIGMDVVKSNVHKMGGEIEVTTQIGQGTEFLIKLFKKSA